MDQRNLLPAILRGNPFRAPTPQGVVILEHPMEVFPSDRLPIFAEGFIKKSLWKSIVFWIKAFTEIEPPSLILDGG